MSTVGQREILTQKRVVAFFRDVLDYTYLGYWKEREGNSNVEKELLSNWLTQQGHNDRIIQKVLFNLDKTVALGGSKSLYDANRELYSLLRYGVKVLPDVGEQTTTIWLIDWANPRNNDFAVAEEVTVYGVNDKRPDLVLYVNDSPWCAGAETFHCGGVRGHPPEPRQPEKGIHSALLRHGTARDGGE